MSNKEQLLPQAQKLFDDKQYNEVITLLTDDVLDKEKSAELYTMRARAHNGLNESDPALDYANKALSYNPQYAAAYRVRGTTFDDKEEYDNAIADYNKAIELDPNDAIAFNNRGIAWSNKKEYDNAIADYNKAIELNPNDADPFNNRGNCWANKKEYDNAIADYNKAIELNPNDTFAYRNRGIIYHDNLNNYQQALDDYNKAIEIEDTAPNIIYWRDAVFEKLKEQQQLLKVITNAGGSKTQKELGDILDKEVDKILKIAITNDGETTVHYTKLFVANKILYPADKKDDNVNPGRMRYYNAIYMNDPAEGECFLECFADVNQKKITDAFNEGKRNNETSVYLGSFLTNVTGDTHEDDLVMWRTYGKDQHKTEAAGCSFVISPDFFDKHEDTKGAGQASEGQAKPADTLIPQRLYKVIYYKSGGYKHDKEKELKTAMASIEKTLMKLIAIQEQLTDEDDKKTIDGTIFKALSPISYLFKSTDYAFENEVRVIQYMPRGTELIQTDESDPPKLYIQSNKSLLPFLKTIYIGPKAENADHWSTYLDFRIRQLKTNDPDKKKYPIEVKKSICRFR